MERIVSQSLLSCGICLSIGSFGRSPNAVLQEQVGVCLLCFDFVFREHLEGFLQGLLPQAFFRGCRGMACLSTQEKRLMERRPSRSARTRLYHQVWKWFTSLPCVLLVRDCMSHPSIPKESELSPCPRKYFQAEGLLIWLCLFALVWFCSFVNLIQARGSSGKRKPQLRKCHHQIICKQADILH